MSRWLLSLMLFLNVAQAQVAVSVNENKVYLDNGDIKVAVPTPRTPSRSSTSTYFLRSCGPKSRCRPR